ncbi:MAG: NAD-dependent epimerase/dehydratase family protein [Candidatus Krumholzibacteria bacterium]|nr:NAD-dependent epimerase/dehydratase family protein [Candidatus Krumholzibacteria bacterium]MDP6669601.1 NAD-dependent epimerase/dehydratase family protein [Candidatus Krumholzibacteria bacterium]MDP6798147.1 NAD-dependent epimerase/dehydratase family protein [Candidatus Krumholzibacteria bacterium]MDP7022006.1 NAD-dependent epimerase/dehydratase family protein [Candidatus Krumholzibacteria bacterium]
MKKILVTGAVGQIGSELIMALREKYGAENVLATGRKTAPSKELLESGPFEYIDVVDKESVEGVMDKYGIDTIYHMAAILSAVGEEKPWLCWSVNMDGLKNILDIGVERELTRVFVPSSIAAFGPETPLLDTPNDTILKPKTMYGVTKVAGELLADYYFKRFGLDCRGVRYPGIISHETLPGGGTTDYAVAIYYDAVLKGSYECFVREDTVLPMMYMPDAIKATIDLMEAPLENLEHHNDFNVAAMSFSVGELAESIRKHIPEFSCTYEPDFRQAIADSWPDSIDDSVARKEWGWKPGYDLDAMTEDMLTALRRKHEQGLLANA